MKKKHLEILLEKCNGYINPKIYYEQYVTPSDIASEMLYLGYLYNDIEGKYILDLGCGTGKLSIGAALLGAKYVLAVDIDNDALKVAARNVKKFGLNNIQMVRYDVKNLCLKKVFDTTIQNPPFGVHNTGIDIVFLEKALTYSKVVYTMHKHETRDFILRYLSRKDVKVTNIIRKKFRLSRLYRFHKKDYKYINIDIYRIERIN